MAWNCLRICMCLSFSFMFCCCVVFVACFGQQSSRVPFPQTPFQTSLLPFFSPFLFLFIVWHFGKSSKIIVRKRKPRSKVTKVRCSYPYFTVYFHHYPLLPSGVNSDLSMPQKCASCSSISKRFNCAKLISQLGGSSILSCFLSAFGVDKDKEKEGGRERERELTPKVAQWSVDGNGVINRPLNLSHCELNVG